MNLGDVVEQLTTSLVPLQVFLFSEYTFAICAFPRSAFGARHVAG